MLNHGAAVNHDRYEARREDDDGGRTVIHKTKKSVSDMTTDELQMHMGEFGGINVIRPISP
jgi:hypothetical protein